MEAAIISDYKATAASMDIAQNPPAIPVKHEALCKFQMSRLLLFHMGLLTLENYSNFHLLDRSAAVTRKILQLDSEPARNCMSVGVLFTRPGQVHAACPMLQNARAWGEGGCWGLLGGGLGVRCLRFFLLFFLNF